MFYYWLIAFITTFFLGFACVTIYLKRRPPKSLGPRKAIKSEPDGYLYIATKKGVTRIAKKG